MKSERNASIELLRIVLMLGIVNLHVFGNLLGAYQRISSALLWCVNGFVFISGYYGVKFSWMRVVKLYGVALFACGIGALMSVGFGDISLELSEVISIALYNFKGYWFLHAYVVLLLISPIINSGLERLPKERLIVTVYPTCFMIFGWAYACSFNSLSQFLPGSAGLSPYSGLTLIGIYIVGRCFRLLEMESYVSKVGVATLIIAMIGGLCVGATKCVNFTSPIAMIMGAMAFCLAKRIRIFGSLELAARYVAPSMFAVLLLHLNSTIYTRLAPWTKAIATGGGFCGRCRGVDHGFRCMFVD